MKNCRMWPIGSQAESLGAANLSTSGAPRRRRTGPVLNLEQSQYESAFAPHSRHSRQGRTTAQKGLQLSGALRSQDARPDRSPIGGCFWAAELRRQPGNPDSRRSFRTSACSQQAGRVCLRAGRQADSRHGRRRYAAAARHVHWLSSWNGHCTHDRQSYRDGLRLPCHW